VTRPLPGAACRCVAAVHLVKGRPLGSDSEACRKTSLLGTAIRGRLAPSPKLSIMLGTQEKGPVRAGPKSDGNPFVE
jgi:hypothetical protein